MTREELATIRARADPEGNPEGRHSLPQAQADRLALLAEVDALQESMAAQARLLSEDCARMAARPRGRCPTCFRLACTWHGTDECSIGRPGPRTLAQLRALVEDPEGPGLDH